MIEDKEYENTLQFLTLNKEIARTRYLFNSYKQHNKETHDIESGLKKLEDELGELTMVLSDPKETPSTQSRFHNLIYQIQVIHDKLNLNEYGNKIDRNQGLILENHIYNDILRDIEGALNWRYIGVSIPTYYYSVASDFDHQPLKSLLHELILELNAMKEAPKTFVDLYKIHSEVKERIIEVANREYTDNRDMDKVYN